MAESFELLLITLGDPYIGAEDRIALNWSWFYAVPLCKLETVS